MTDVTIIIGSENDKKFAEVIENKLAEIGLSYQSHVYSAHRNLDELNSFLKSNQTKVYITAAGLSAALPGVVCAQVKQPVIGVPLAVGELNGIDALLSILQMPKGIPLATMGIGKQGLINSALFAAKILGK